MAELRLSRLAGLGVATKFDPDEPRDEQGRWTDGGGDGAGEGSETGEAAPVRTPLDHAVIQAHIDRVSAAAGFDRRKITISDETKHFTLNDKQYVYAGSADTRKPMPTSTGAIEPSQPITIYSKHVAAENVAGVIRHEIEHIKFQTALDRYEEEYQKVVAEPGDQNPAGFPDHVMLPSGKLKPPFDEKYPAYTAIHETLKQHSAKDFAEADGVSAYSYEYWKGWKDRKVPFETAVHETLSEMARIKYETGKFPDHWGERIIAYRGENVPKPSKQVMAANAKRWRDLYRAVEKVAGLPETKSLSQFWPKFDPDEPRDESGKWTDGGGGDGGDGGAPAAGSDNLKRAPDPPPAARARGFDTVAYHATTKEFDQFAPPAGRGATFFAPTPEGAMKGHTGGATEAQGEQPSSGPPQPVRIVPVYMRSEDIKGLSLTPTEQQWWKAAPAKLEEAQVDDVMKTSPFDSPHWYFVYDEHQRPDGAFEYTKREMPSISLEQANKTGKDVYGEMIAGYNEGLSADRSSAERVKQKGMSAFIISDEGGVSVAHVEPHNPDKVSLVSDWHKPKALRAA